MSDSIIKFEIEKATSKDQIKEIREGELDQQKTFYLNQEDSEKLNELVRLNSDSLSGFVRELIQATIDDELTKFQLELRRPK